MPRSKRRSTIKKRPPRPDNWGKPHGARFIARRRGASICVIDTFAPRDPKETALTMAAARDRARELTEEWKRSTEAQEAAREAVRWQRAIENVAARR